MDSRTAEAAGEDRYRALVEAISDYAIVMLDPDGHVLSWNAGAFRCEGYTEEEVVGQHFSRFHTVEDQANGVPARALATARREGRFEVQGWRVRKDGTRFWAHVSITPIVSPDGGITGFARIIRDLTERKQAEQAMAEASAELLQVQKMEAVGRLTGGVAHDFNNLLMAIGGSLELLRKRLPPDERLLRLVDNAMQGIERGAVLTQRMLAFARRQELMPEPVDVGGLIAGMVDLLARSLGPSIEIETRVPEGLSRILVDANQLELAVLNLAINAKDAMPGGGRLTISAREAEGGQGPMPVPGRYVCLSVADTGEGMDAATLEHATEPFFTTKGVGKGTGLGLAMVRGLTEQSGGTMGIESRMGAGTTVTLWIPVSAQVPRPAALRAEPEPEPARHEAAPRLKVLVVDDDLLVAMSTTAMLEDLGHEAVEVHSGRQALEALAASPGFDVIITDQAMPQMTGMQLLAAVRERWPGLRAILATGYAELPEQMDRDVLRLGKPFMQTDLERALRQLERFAV